MEPSLIQFICGHFRLNINSIHGLNHWKRVERLGLLLSEATKADIEVVSHFAYLHDSERWDEYKDIEHGARAAERVRKLFDSGLIKLTDLQLHQLSFACSYHTGGTVELTKDMTVRTCWDADRLDLWRIGVTPDPRSLLTDAARSPEMFALSKALALS